MHTGCERSEIQLSGRDEARACELFKMLGEPSRLKVVCALMNAKVCVAHLAEQLEMEQSALSHQLGNLKRAGIVKSEKSGKQVFYSLDDMHVFDIIQTAIKHVRHTQEGEEK